MNVVANILQTLTIYQQKLNNYIYDTWYLKYYHKDQHLLYWHMPLLMEAAHWRTGMALTSGVTRWSAPGVPQCNPLPNQMNTRYTNIISV